MATFPGDPPVYTSSDVSAEAHLEWLFNQNKFGSAIEYFLNQLVGGSADGVVAVGAPPIPTDALKAQGLGTPGMQVQVLQGAAFLSSQLIYNASTWTSPVLGAPSTNPRYDLIQISQVTWEITVKQGVESGSPSAPTPDANNLGLFEIRHRVGETAIEDTDYSGSTNGYLEDIRTYCNA